MSPSSKYHSLLATAVIVTGLMVSMFTFSSYYSTSGALRQLPLPAPTTDNSHAKVAAITDDHGASGGTRKGHKLTSSTSRQATVRRKMRTVRPTNSNPTTYSAKTSAAKLNHSSTKSPSLVQNRSAVVLSTRYSAVRTSSKRQHCKLPRCMDYFSDMDRVLYKRCKYRQARKRKGNSSPSMGECQFMRGKGRAPVALASLPGSGNTWVRGLLEKATGICTGSVYCDGELRDGGFNGETIRSGTVLAVKTHHLPFPCDDTLAISTAFSLKYHEDPCYGAVILLLRNPYHAIVAEYNRLGVVRANRKQKEAGIINHTDSHIESIDLEKFGPNADWSRFIWKKMSEMKNMTMNVMLDSPPQLPKLVVHYEDFQRDRVREVSRVLDFLNFPYSRETLSQRLEEDFSTFHRNKHVEFEPYTQSQEQFIERCLRNITETLSSKNGDTLGIKEYLRH